jgi:enamine deaminase RidA (YjgF/YER057c/UK114 family)
MTGPSLPLEIVNPAELGRPRGFAHGVLAPAGARVLFVAGQTAADADGRITATDFAEQFETALRRVLAVVGAAGGSASAIARMTVYVVSMQQYIDSRAALRTIWLRTIGSHYPAMTLVEVTALADRGAAVEIDAMAVVP